MINLLFIYYFYYFFLLFICVYLLHLITLLLLLFRFLLLPLVNAERAWAYAMQLRHLANTEPRKRFHLIKRLKKAALHAAALAELCQHDICDVRTKLEAQVSVLRCGRLL